MFQRLKRRIKKCLRNEEGNSLVELALVLPILVNIMAIGIEGGWVVSQQAALERMADAVAQTIEPTTTLGDLQNYIGHKYSSYNLADLELHPGITSKKLDYSEHIYRKDVDSHWAVAMYYQRTVAKLKVDYELTYLTPWGKYLFGTSDNKKELHATGVSIRIKSNDAY